jgi:hypothetical protein
MPSTYEAAAASVLEGVRLLEKERAAFLKDLQEKAAEIRGANRQIDEAQKWIPARCTSWECKRLVIPEAFTALVARQYGTEVIPLADALAGNAGYCSEKCKETHDKIAAEAESPGVVIPFRAAGL